MLLLEQPTLVLNRNWIPIHTLPVKVAIALVARGSAQIIDPDSYEVHDLISWDSASRSKELAGKYSSEDLFIRSAKLALAPLEVIVLTDYSGVGDKTVTFSRLNLYRRDRYTCQYCGEQTRFQRTHDRSRPTEESRWRPQLGKLRPCVPCLQQKKEQSNARGSWNASLNQTDRTSLAKNSPIPRPPNL